MLFTKSVSFILLGDVKFYKTFIFYRTSVRTTDLHHHIRNKFAAELHRNTHKPYLIWMARYKDLQQFRNEVFAQYDLNSSGRLVDNCYRHALEIFSREMGNACHREIY